MANVRQIRKRLRAVRNIRTITKTLQTISASRLHRIHAHQVAIRPVVEALNKSLRSLVAATGPQAHPLLREGQGNVCAVILASSDRSMCGGYNTRAVDSALETAAELVRSGKKVRLFLIGKKGTFLLRARLTRPRDGPPLGEEALAPPHLTAPAFEERRLYQQVSELSGKLCEAFMAGELASAHVVRMRIISQGSPRPAVDRILPVPVEPAGPDQAPQHDFYPDAQAVLESLLPMAVRVRLLACFIEAGVSENTARLTAMSAATHNADDMTRKLTMDMNRARQGRITSELAEIVGGADAVEGKR